MKPFAGYADTLQRLLKTAQDGRLAPHGAEIEAALDGQPSAELRRLVEVQDLRASGAFFSGSTLATELLEPFRASLGHSCFITDPACGAGDLLLECAKNLPVKSTFHATLAHWGESLCGLDIHKEFVDVARIRLALLAIQRNVPPASIANRDLKKLFPHIAVKDGLQGLDEIRRSTHIVMNPPFAPFSAPINCQWASGLINGSAVFLETIIQNAMPGTFLFAILPDVLRSGSRYARLRTIVSSKCIPTRLHLGGQFDKTADVDIFFFEARVGQPSKPFGWEWPSSSKQLKTVGDFFDIHVGPVVPFRHAKKGPCHRYLTTHNAPPWETVSQVDEQRRFSGTVFHPPLVVVRRTSRCNDHFRAVGTIMNTKSGLAIENHLLVLLPRDGSLKTCQKLLRCLKRLDTTAWLNDRICCRHLTVSSLASLPCDGI